MGHGWIVPGLVLAVIAAGCATPEVAEEYEAKTYLPEEIATALRSEDPTQRAEAADQVSTLPPARRRAALLDLTRDDRAHVRLLAVGLLGSHHGGEAIVQARLIDVLAFDPDTDVRAAAVNALAVGGTPRSLDALVEALSDDASLVVRQAAAESLDRITGQTLADPFTGAVEQALDRADDTLAAYEEWVEENRARLRWDPDAGRFVVEEAGGDR